MDMAIKLQEVADRSLRNEGRIKKLESESEALHQLATSVAVMAEQLQTMNSNVIKLTDDVECLKDKPAKRWDGIVDKFLVAVIAALVGFIFAKLGI